MYHQLNRFFLVLAITKEHILKANNNKSKFKQGTFIVLAITKEHILKANNNQYKFNIPVCLVLAITKEHILKANHNCVCAITLFSSVLAIPILQSLIKLSLR